MTPARRADLAYFGAFVAALLCLVVFGVLQRRIELIGHDDFSRIWAGARAVVNGQDPYDPQAWVDLALGLGTLVPDTSVYIYPPWVALALRPLALLPLGTAAFAWLGLSLAAAAAGLRALLRAYNPGVRLRTRSRPRRSSRRGWRCSRWSSGNGPSCSSEW